MTKENSFTKNEKKFEQWLLQQYGMTNKEQREYTLKGNLESLWEIFSAADMVLFARGLPSIGKELAQLGKKAVDDVAEEAIEKTVASSNIKSVKRELGTDKTIINSAGQKVTRKYVKNQDELLEKAEKAAGGNLDDFKEIKPGWYQNKEGTVKIEWNPEGHANTNEGPHVTVRHRNERGGWTVVEKYFIEGKDYYR